LYIYMPGFILITGKMAYESKTSVNMWLWVKKTVK